MNFERLRTLLINQALHGRLLQSERDEQSGEEAEGYYCLPQTWEWRTLKEMVTPTKQKVPTGQFTYIDVSSISHFNVKDAKVLDGTEAPSRARKIVNEGMVLFSMVRPYLKNICIASAIEGKQIASTAFATMTCKEGLLNKYLLYVFRSDFFMECVKERQRGISYPAIGEKDFYGIKIPLPSMEEQVRIVAKLDRVFGEIDRAEKAYRELQNLSEVLRGKILQEAIQGKLVPHLAEEGVVEQIGDVSKEVPFAIPEQWKWVRLSDLSLDMADGPFGSNLKKEHYTSQREVRIIQLSNIGERGWRNENVKYTTFTHAETISRSRVSAGDIVIAKMMPAGRAVIVPEIEKGFVLSSDAVKVVVDKERCLTKYLNFVINSSVFKNQVYSNVQGTTRIRTSLSKLKNYLVPLPPLKEQQRIVEKVEELLKQIDRITS